MISLNPYQQRVLGTSRDYFRECVRSGSASSAFANCAVFLDRLDEVTFWVRNIARRPSSFALQISTGAFYPDFVCRLHDGRFLVVKYKGKPWYEMEQSEEKRAVGMSEVPLVAGDQWSSFNSG